MLELPFTLEPGGTLPLYEQLYGHLARLIRTGGLAAGSRLPGKRSLAEALGVSVNTVDTAYQMLAAEGYLESRPRSGFVVQQMQPLGEIEGGAAGGGTVDGGTAPPPAGGLPGAAEGSAAEGAAADQTAATAPAAPVRFDLSTSGVDTALFPFRSWGRIQKELLYSAPELLGHGHRQGDENLRGAIAAYLRAYRGVQCGPEQVVVGAGLEYLLGLLARLLVGGCAAVENPGYARSRTVLENNGIPCIPLDIDRGGLPVGALTGCGARIAYVTPSHQFPTGVTMPAGRRAELLAWARGGPDRLILEDDYDSEFRYDIRPLPSLQGMAGPDGPVIYLTTFSKSLAPSIRIACMVLPRPLLARYRAMYGAYASTVSRFEQQTLTRFLEDGLFTRHLARLRKAYRLRMETLAVALEAAFGPERLRLQGRHSGLHLLLSLTEGPDERQMVARAAAAGVRLAGLSGYYMARPERCPPRTVVVGYAGLPPGDIPLLAETLARAWD